MVREKLEIVNAFAGEYRGRIVCDTTPLAERYYAANSGSGFIGKNAMLIHPLHGSYFFLAFILFEKKLPDLNVYPDLKKSDYIFTAEGKYDFAANLEKFCASCDKCTKACPGDAIRNGLINSQRCYSYWSIENKLGFIQAKFKDINSVFGCDICQDVCPYNARSFSAKLPDFKISEVSRKIIDGNLENLNLKGTSYERTGITGLRRNLNFINTAKEIRGT